MSPPSLRSEPLAPQAVLESAPPALSDAPHGRAPTACLSFCGPRALSGVLREFTGTSTLCPRATRLEGQGCLPPGPTPVCGAAVQCRAVLWP